MANFDDKEEFSIKLWKLQLVETYFKKQTNKVIANSIVKKISSIFLFGSSEATSSSLSQQGLLGGYLQGHLEGDLLGSHQGDHGGQLEGNQQAHLEGSQQAQLEGNQKSRLEGDLQAHIEVDHQGSHEGDQWGQLEVDQQAHIEWEHKAHLEGGQQAQLEGDQHVHLEGDQPPSRKHAVPLATCGGHAGSIQEEGALPASEGHDGASPTLGSGGSLMASTGSCKITEPQPGHELSKQVKNCVSVIIQSIRKGNKKSRSNVVLRVIKEVEQYLSPASVRWKHRSSPGVQGRLDFCFYSQLDACQFVRDLNNMKSSKSRQVKSLLMPESDLGYEYEPVLDEKDLLVIQSLDYCRNIFRTSIEINVVKDGDCLSYCFNSVCDVNRFLFNKSSKYKSLGQLRSSSDYSNIISDSGGFFRLFTSEHKISTKFAEKHNFKISNESGYNYLLFNCKYDLFSFLVSEVAAAFEHLQFDQSRIRIVTIVKDNESEVIDPADE